ncbi:MAG: hypothetical protein IIA89_12215 [Chloroflexi bacterium]|nr:hypothetical protein [Chloroflexota bacterium]MCH8877568.1 hypothetical protein [Chloroflexota bacterium]
MPDEPQKFIDYLSIEPALAACVTETTQGQRHIKPLHMHFSMRLVLEGGFLPQEITPHPPFAYEIRSGRHYLTLDESVGTLTERTVIGGVRSKQIDVVVTKPSIGPVVAISFKGTQKAFRNLTNRMEEALGDCTNIHLAYPSLVYGFYHVILANRPDQIGKHRLVGNKNDVSVSSSDVIEPQVQRYLLAIQALSGRKTQWEDPSSYEAVALHFVESSDDRVSRTFESIPVDSPLHRDLFFGKLLEAYDVRYPYMAERVREAKRVQWEQESPIVESLQDRLDHPFEDFLGYTLRFAS